MIERLKAAIATTLIPLIIATAIPLFLLKIMGQAEDRVPASLQPVPTLFLVGTVTPMPAPTFTPTPYVPPPPVDSEKEDELARKLETVDRLLFLLDGMIEEHHDSLEVAAETGPMTPVEPEPTPTAAPRPWENVAACEDGGTCRTPPQPPVAHLCGAEGLGGFVLRWADAPGDTYAGVVASPEFLAPYAYQMDGPTLIWAGGHPRSGELVTVHFLPRELEIQLAVGGRPVWRVRSDGKYTEFR